MCPSASLLVSSVGQNNTEALGVTRIHGCMLVCWANVFCLFWGSVGALGFFVLLFLKG